MADYKLSCAESAAIHRLLQVSETPRGLFGFDAVNQYVKTKLAVEEDWVAERVGWWLLGAVTAVEEEGERRPLLAARHLMGLYEYPVDSSEPFGWAKKPFKKYATNVGSRTDGYVLNLGQRQEIAANEGGYGTSRSTLSGKKPRLGEVAEATWRAFSDAIDQLETADVQQLIHDINAAGKPTWYPEKLRDDSEKKGLDSSPVQDEEDLASTDGAGYSELPSVGQEQFSELTSSQMLLILGSRLRSAAFRAGRSIVSRGKRHPFVLGLGFLLILSTLSVGLLFVSATEFGARSRERQDAQFLSQVQSSRPEVGVTKDWSLGWGPERAAFSPSELGPSRPTFNSVTGPDFDQRSFVSVQQDAQANPEEWEKNILARAGNRITMKVFVGNSARTAEDDIDTLAIQDARISVGLSQQDRICTIFVLLTASNALSVWDGVQLSMPEGGTVHLETESTRFTNSAQPAQGVPIDSDIFTAQGAKLGFWDLDGVVRAGEHFSGYVYVHLRVDG